MSYNSIKKKLFNFLLDYKLLFLYKLLVLIRRLTNKRIKKFKASFKNYEIIGEKNFETFTGYYDLDVVSPDERRLIFHRIKKHNNSCEIVLYDFSEQKKFFVLSETKAWSWQLGARLQWIDNQKIFYNCVDTSTNILHGVILDINTKIKENIPYPIFDISNDKTKGLILDFQTLHNQRQGYGYNFIQNKFTKHDISIYDFKIKSILKNININELKTKHSLEGYYINHLSWSPDNISFIFYLVKTHPRDTILYFHNDQSNLINIEKVKQISHHEWISAREIIFFGKVENNKGFYILNLNNLNIKKIEHMFSDIDGHINSSDKKNFIIDSYPDRYQDRYLYNFNIETKNTKLFGKFLNNVNFRNDRKCDLHPKYSRNHNYLMFDTSHNGYRQIFFVKNLKK